MKFRHFESCLFLLALMLASSCTSSKSASNVDLSGSGCLVLAYHRVVPESLTNFFVSGADDYTIYQENLVRQIQSLKGYGGTFIRPSELEDHAADG